MDIEHAFTQHRYVCTCGRARADTIREGASACVSGALASAAARTWCLRICIVYLHEYLHAYVHIRTWTASPDVGWIDVEDGLI